MDYFKYSNHVQLATGFDNAITHSLYGYWRNSEYQEEQQLPDKIQHENDLQLQNCLHEQTKKETEYDLPF